jgi:hypothetical protein
LNPFTPPNDATDPDDPNAGQKPPRRSFAVRLASLRFQAFLCFSVAALALLFGHKYFKGLSYTVVVLGVGCGVQCLWRDSKRRDSPFEARRRR